MGQDVESEQPILKNLIVNQPKMELLPEVPILKALITSYDRPVYSLLVYPQLFSLNVSWGRPQYENTNTGNNPVFAFGGV